MERPVSVNMPSMRLYPARARFLVWAVAYALASAAVLASIPFLFGSPQPIVLIHWREVSASERRSLEREFGLTEATQRNGDTWGYVPTRTSPDALHAIVTHPSVADTDGIDRRALTIADSPPLTPRRGGLLEAPAIARAARVLAYALACLASILGCCGPHWCHRPCSPTHRFAGRSAGRCGRSREHSRRCPGWRAPGCNALGGQHGQWRPPASCSSPRPWRGGFSPSPGSRTTTTSTSRSRSRCCSGSARFAISSTPGGRLMYLVSAGAWRVAGDTLATEWTIVAGGLALGAASTVAAGYRLSGSLAIAVLVTILEILNLPADLCLSKGTGVRGCCLGDARARSPSISTACRADGSDCDVRVPVPSRSRSVHRRGIRGVPRTGESNRRLAGCRRTGSGAHLDRDGVSAALDPICRVQRGLIAYFQVGVEYSRNEADATALASWPTLHLASPVLSMANAEAWLFWLF